MKKYILLLFTLLSLSSLSAQNTFQLWNFNAKDGMEESIAKLATEQFENANFKSGGIQIERIEHGNNPWSHRIILFGEVGKIGRVEGDLKEFEWDLFRAKLDRFILEWGTSEAGRFLSIEGGTWIDFPYVQIYNLELDNSSAFKSAHDKFVKQTSKTRGNRPIAFGTYDIGGGNNSHWVAIGAKDFSDLISQKVINEGYKKEWAEWRKNNGGAVSSSNYSVRVLGAFTNQ